MFPSEGIYKKETHVGFLSHTGQDDEVPQTPRCYRAAENYAALHNEAPCSASVRTVPVVGVQKVFVATSHLIQTQLFPFCETTFFGSTQHRRCWVYLVCQILGMLKFPNFLAMHLKRLMKIWLLLPSSNWPNESNVLS